MIWPKPLLKQSPETDRLPNHTGLSKEFVTLWRAVFTSKLHTLLIALYIWMICVFLTFDTKVQHFIHRKVKQPTNRFDQFCVHNGENIQSLMSSATFKVTDT